MVLDRPEKASLPLGMQKRTDQKDYCRFASVFPATKPGVRSTVLLIRWRSPDRRGQTRAILRSALSCPYVLQNKARISTLTLIGRAGGGGAWRWKSWGTSTRGGARDTGRGGTFPSPGRSWDSDHRVHEKLWVPSQTVWLTAVNDRDSRSVGTEAHSHRKLIPA